MTDLHRVWFERPIVPELAAEVASRVTMLGPGTDDEPFVGLATAAAVLAGTSRCDAGFMDRAPGLQVIARTGIGVDGVDLVEATRRGIAVTNTPDGPTVSTAEHAVTLIMMVAKNVKRAESALRAGVSNGYYVTHEAIELDGKVLGLVGFGRIARRVARIADGIGMQVMTHDPFLPEASFPAGATRAGTLEELLRAADVVSIHVPLTDASRGMFGSEQFGQMKPGAIFVNTARGGLVDGDALLAALDGGRLFGAGLDVSFPEPLPPGHPLLGRDDVVVTPHIASGTTDGKARIFRSAFEQALDVLDGRRPEHLVNPEVWERVASGRGPGVGG